MTPGVPVVESIEVTCSGTLTPADIRRHGTGGGVLAGYFDTTIEAASGGGYLDCGGFIASPMIYSSTLTAFSVTHAGWETGLTALAAAANPTSKILRFTVDV